MHQATYSSGISDTMGLNLG